MTGRVTQIGAAKRAPATRKKKTTNTPKNPAEALVDDTATSTGETGAVAAGAKEKGPSQATQLVQIAEESFRVLLGEDGSGYAVRLDGPNLALPMRGRAGLRQVLARTYYARHATTPAAGALTDALEVLGGQAADHDREFVALRLARHQDAIVIDLGTADGRCVIVRPGRWELADRSPVLFRRTALSGEMPTPAASAGEQKLDDVLSGLVNAGPSEVRLLVGYLVAGLIPDLPHPILAIFGEQGTAKTTLMRLIAMLIDPSPAPTRTAPRDVKQWAVCAAASWFIGLDNVSTVSDWQSDAYCRAVTGDALTDRALYSDGDVSVISFRRVLALTSIDAGSLRGDLGDRMLPVELDRIDPTERRTDQHITAEFTAAAPALLGGLLDLLAQVLAKLPTITTTSLPRMADFARVLTALDEVTGWTTVDDYAGTAADIAETVIDSDPFAVAVRDLAVSKSEWTGTAAQLRAEVTPEKPPKDWPKSPRAVSGAVRRITPALRSVGISVEHGHDGRGNTRVRTITLSAPQPDNKCESTSPPSPPSPERSDQHERGDGQDGPTVPTADPPTGGDGRAAQPSPPGTGSDLHKHRSGDGGDGGDAGSHKLYGATRCSLCGLPSTGRLDVDGRCRECTPTSNRKAG